VLAFLGTCVQACVPERVPVRIDKDVSGHVRISFLLTFAPQQHTNLPAITSPSLERVARGDMSIHSWRLHLRYVNTVSLLPLMYHQPFEEHRSWLCNICCEIFTFISTLPPDIPSLPLSRCTHPLSCSSSTNLAISSLFFVVILPISVILGAGECESEWECAYARTPVRMLGYHQSPIA
jgi:hypothetical protein